MGSESDAIFKIRYWVIFSIVGWSNIVINTLLLDLFSKKLKL